MPGPTFPSVAATEPIEVIKSTPIRVIKIEPNEKTTTYNIVKAKILQIKILSKNEYVGYNQTYKAQRKVKIAILGIGYGDGIC